MPQQELATIVSTQHLADAVHLIWAKAPDLAASARPGQFVMVLCGEGYEPYLRRPFSIHRVDRTAGNVALLFAEVGRGSRWLAGRQPGQALDVLGPLGNGFSMPQGPGASLLLVAGGLGIAPLMALAESALVRGDKVTLLHGTPTATRLYPPELCPPGLEVVTATEDGSAGIKGMVSELLPGFVKDADAVYACGPVDMYRTMARMKGLFAGKPVQVSLEVRMGCGLGACFGCTVITTEGPKRVCLDGPVFELGQVC